MTTIKLTKKEIYSLALDCLNNNGASVEHAEAVADTITKAEGDLCQSHGLFRLPGYVACLQSGKVNGSPQLKSEQIASAVVRVDGNNCFAPLAHKVGLPKLIETAKGTGIAALSLIGIHHFSALWVEIETLTEQGLAGLAFTSYMPTVAPAGGNKPFYGTNPMAFGWPRENKAPLIFDQASATLARGEIMIAARDGEKVPFGVGIDSQGQATTNPNEILKGAQLAFGGYKGASIALMIELLVGPLLGEVTSYEAAQRDNKDGGPPQGGELIIAIDPTKFGFQNGFSQQTENFINKLLEQPGTRLPGERRYLNREKTINHPIEVNTDLYAKIQSLL